jgi:hypothetical protein
MPGGDEKQVAAATKRHAEAERKLSEEKIRAEGLARRSERARAEADRYVHSGAQPPNGSSPTTPSRSTPAATSTPSAASPSARNTTGK